MDKTCSDCKQVMTNINSKIVDRVILCEQKHAKFDELVDALYRSARLLHRVRPHGGEFETCKVISCTSALDLLNSIEVKHG